MISSTRMDQAALRVDQTKRPDNWKFDNSQIEGKRVIITGGTTGIGRTTAILLGSLGAKVLIFGRHQDALDDALECCKASNAKVTGLTADVSDESQVKEVFEKADEALGGLDILINNAALAGKSVTETETEDFDYILRTNVLGYMSCAKHAIERMQKGGKVINVGSLSAQARSAGSDIYVTTKSALRGFSQSLGKQVQEDEIYVTLVEPGLVGSDLTMGDKSPQTEREKLDDGEMLTSECIAEAVLFCLALPTYCWVPLLQMQPVHQKVAG